MPPLRPPGVGEPTVPMTRSASAERAFCFGAGASTCRPFPCCLRPFPCCLRPSPCCPRPSVLLLSAPSVPLPRARPSLCLVPVHSCAAHTRPSPFIPTLSVPVHFCAAHAARRRLSLRCPCQFVPRCPCTSIPAQPVATHSLLPVPVGPRTARRLSTCFRCGGIRSGGSGMTVAASTCRPVVL